MFDNLLALEALSEHGTMQRAAAKLHITQSAVSKRIANLEHSLKKKLIEPRGRKVELTPMAHRVLERVKPLLADVREFLLEEGSEATGRLVVDVSGSVLISWGAEALGKALESLPDLTLDINTHHASIAVERVRSGESMIAIAQGKSTIAPDLGFLPLFEQTMVIIPSGLKKFGLPKRGALDVLAIEEHTEAWEFIQQGLRKNGSAWGFTVKAARRLQSFSAIVQMARAGFGHGLAPLGVAKVLGVPAAKTIPLPSPGLSVPVSLMGRKSTLARPAVQALYKAILKTKGF